MRIRPRITVASFLKFITIIRDWAWTLCVYLFTCDPCCYSLRSQLWYLHITIFSKLFDFWYCDLVVRSSIVWVLVWWRNRWHWAWRHTSKENVLRCLFEIKLTNLESISQLYPIWLLSGLQVPKRLPRLTRIISLRSFVVTHLLAFHSIFSDLLAYRHLSQLIVQPRWLLKLQSCTACIPARRLAHFEHLLCY